MHRNALLSLILDYRNAHPEEALTIGRFTSFIKQNKDCFKRELETGHLTGSAWLVNLDQTKVLLTHHRKLNRWLQLGGHADGESDILSVAMREAYEESGLNQIIPVKKEIFDLDIHRIPERGKECAHDHYDIRFALQAVGSEDFQVSEESHDLSWIDIVSFHQMTSETSMLRMQNKWLTKHGAA